MLMMVSLGSGSTPVSSRMGEPRQRLPGGSMLQFASDSHTLGGGSSTSTSLTAALLSKKNRYIPAQLWVVRPGVLSVQGLVRLHSAYRSSPHQARISSPTGRPVWSMMTRQVTSLPYQRTNHHSLAV